MIRRYMHGKAGSFDVSCRRLWMRTVSRGGRNGRSRT